MRKGYDAGWPARFDKHDGKQYPAIRPFVKVGSDSNTDMNEILAHTDLTPGEKVKLYGQILERYIVYKELITASCA